MADLSKLRKRLYDGTPLEGLEDCVPKFRNTSIVLLTGKSHKSHKGGGRRGRRIYNRKKLPRRPLASYRIDPC